jgi:hypothetical protein
MGELVVERRFRGPPDSGNGGYVAGLVAGAFAPGSAVEVTLRRPPPLDRSMSLVVDGRRAVLRGGATVVAEGVPVGDVDVDVPPPVSYTDALAAARGSYVLEHRDRHPFPGCVVCGFERDDGDGLRIFVGPVDGQRVAAAAWRPDPSLAGPDGSVRPAFVWAALDFSGGIGSIYVDGKAVDDDLPTYVLGRLTARVDTAPVAGDECVVTGWRIGASGRKLDAGSAVHRADGTPLASARATWIALREP